GRAEVDVPGGTVGQAGEGRVARVQGTAVEGDPATQGFDRGVVHGQSQVPIHGQAGVEQVAEGVRAGTVAGIDPVQAGRDRAVHHDGVQAVVLAHVAANVMDEVGRHPVEVDGGIGRARRASGGLAGRGAAAADEVV